MEQDYSQDHIELDSTEVGPRRLAHPKPTYGPADVMKWLLRPFELAPRTGTIVSKDISHHRKPTELRSRSRFGARRRARRLRYMRKLQAVLWGKRVGYTLLVAVAFVLVAFWAKFAIVYGLPPYVRVGSLASARAYVVWKAWWFGPTSFNLSDYSGIDPLNPLQSLALQLSEYKDIVTNPQEILFIFTNKF